MRLTRRQYSILSYIYRHNYIAYSKLKNHFQKIPEHILCKIIEQMKKDNLISYRVYDNEEIDDGTEQRSLSDPVHLICINEGCVIIETRRQKFWGFFLPYVITTIIAIAGVIIPMIK